MFDYIYQRTFFDSLSSRYRVLIALVERYKYFPSMVDKSIEWREKEKN